VDVLDGHYAIPVVVQGVEVGVGYRVDLSLVDDAVAVGVGLIEISLCNARLVQGRALEWATGRTLLT
jgi:hypothetical protein